MRVKVNGTEIYVDVDGAQLDVGDGMLRERPTIVALHGGPGFDHGYLRPGLAPLAGDAQVVYVDLRGQGRSGRPAIETCTLEQMADDVAALCAGLGIERPIILGHSAGGFVTLTLATRHPHLAERLILVDTAAATAAMSDSMSILQQRNGAEARAAAERMFGGDFSEPAVNDFIRLVFPAYLANPSNMATLGPTIGRCNFNPEVAAFYFSTRAPLYDLRDKLAGIRQPTLVLVGEQDWLTPPGTAQALAAGLPSSELVVLPDAGHFAFVEQPDIFNTAVRQFAAAPTLVGVGGI